MESRRSDVRLTAPRNDVADWLAARGTAVFTVMALVLVAWAVVVVAVA